MRVMTIQSQVVLGHVGNSAAVFALQRLGIDVLAVPTLLYSNHPAYGAHKGRMLTPAEAGELIDGVVENTSLSDCEAVLSGYLGEAGMADVVLAAVERVRAANPNGFYACDPVLGDTDKGLYVAAPVAEAIRERLVPQCEVLTPNCWELGWLTGRGVTTPGDVLVAARPLVSEKPRFVVVTSVPVSDRTIGIMLITPEGAWLAATPRRLFRRQPNGGGDLAAAVFLAQLLRTQDPVKALGATASGVYAVFAATAQGERELSLVLAQDALVAPPSSFPVEKFG